MRTLPARALGDGVFGACDEVTLSVSLLPSVPAATSSGLLMNVSPDQKMVPVLLVAKAVRDLGRLR